jgi:hypothetical protein
MRHMALRYKAFDLYSAVEAALIFIVVHVNGSLLSLPLICTLMYWLKQGTVILYRRVSHESSSELIISVYPPRKT